MTQLYYDTFADEVVTDINEFAPPERYIRVHCGSDVFIEKWSVGNGKFLNIVYTRFDREQGFVYLIRREQAEKHNVNLQFITDWTVTSEHYKKMKGSEE